MMKGEGSSSISINELVELVWSCELGARVGFAFSPEGWMELELLVYRRSREECEGFWVVIGVVVVLWVAGEEKVAVVGGLFTVAARSKGSWGGEG
ncbi:hypothetical protein KY285_031124 [Solanum tuberosum]|nr:hypothetical protein KY285_031124 [Solanum tuberosum]